MSGYTQTQLASRIKEIRRALATQALRTGRVDLRRAEQERELIEELVVAEPALLLRRTPDAVAAAIVYANEVMRRQRGDGRDATITQASVAAGFDVAKTAITDLSLRFRSALRRGSDIPDSALENITTRLTALIRSGADPQLAINELLQAFPLPAMSFEQPSSDPRERARRRPRPGNTKRRATSTTPVRSVLRIKITLRNVRPPVWRRVEVASDTTLARLHHIVQAAMGWENCHLHEFNDDEYAYSSNDPEFVDAIDSLDVTIGELAGEGDLISYWYDFGDDWWHDLTIESATQILPGTSSPEPRLVGGRGGCPPEDFGGPFTYSESHLAASATFDDTDFATALAWHEQRS